jgi:hypothetical protein
MGYRDGPQSPDPIGPRADVPGSGLCTFACAGAQLRIDDLAHGLGPDGAVGDVDGDLHRHVEQTGGRRVRMASDGIDPAEIRAVGLAGGAGMGWICGDKDRNGGEQCRSHRGSSNCLRLASRSHRRLKV